MTKLRRVRARVGISVVSASQGHRRNPRHPQKETVPDAGIPKLPCTRVT